MLLTDTPVTAQASPAPPPTLLGQGAPRIPTGGKIRPGIKVLTRAAAELAQARAIYQTGMDRGLSFEQIERELANALPKLKSPLMPRNVPWFSVREQDFPNPEVARQILEAYGEDRGEGRHLYRFPAVFLSDSWQSVMPHELACWGANEKKFWSQYSSDGQARHCMCHAPVPIDHTGCRAIRLFGGRKVVQREDNGGTCNPEACAQYQSRQCNLTGRFLFYIPGIRTINALELPTNSFYAMSNAIQRFQAIGYMRGGRIAGFLGRNRATFHFTKTLREVPHIDETGRAVRVPQWLIDLEAAIDVTALLREGDDEDAVIAQAGFSARMLEDTVPTSPPPAPPEASPEAEVQAAPQEQRPPALPENPALDQILSHIEAAGISVERFMRYADSCWGSGWKLNPHGRESVWGEIVRYRNDPEGYADKIDAAIGVAA
ncbi:MAG: hypothetical protein FWD51_01670 [Betaproteobacteria bacterium]|nr:hypothetical protein [Betaproteobacteria bacterium]